MNHVFRKQKKPLKALQGVSKILLNITDIDQILYELYTTPLPQ